jgi:hypothetical protein
MSFHLSETELRPGARGLGPAPELVDAEKCDAGAIRRGADSTAFIAANLPNRTNRASTWNSTALGLTKLFGAGPAERRTNPAALVAAELIRPARAPAALLANGRAAELACAALPKRDTTAAALVATVFAGSADRLVALLVLAEFVGARRVDRHTHTAAIRAARCPLETEHRSAWVVVVGNADARAISSARVGVTSITRVIDTGVAWWAGKPGNSAAHPAWDSNLGPCASPARQRRHNGGESHSQDSTPGWLTSKLSCETVKCGVVHEASPVLACYRFHGTDSETQDRDLMFRGTRRRSVAT